MTTVAEKKQAKQLLEGSKAIVEAAILAGCRFYAGYPIQPSTSLLEQMSRRMPQVGGVCMNAESELEAIHMVWGASAAGVRAMTTSTGTGLSLMQEAFAEGSNMGLPFVVCHMSRGQSEYFMITRGGGHGDYHFIVLAPSTVQEAADLTQLAFYLAEKYRTPALIQGDFVLGHTVEAVEFKKLQEPDLPPKTWTIGGATGRPARSISFTGGDTLVGEKENYGKVMESAADKYPEIERREQRVETEFLDDARLVVVAFGYAARFARFAVGLARQAGLRVGFIRPITLWPFPNDAIQEAARKTKAFAVFELNPGKMVQDVRLIVLGAVPVHFIGGISQDPSGFGVGPLLNPDTILERIKGVYAHL